MLRLTQRLSSPAICSRSFNLLRRLFASASFTVCKMKREQAGSRVLSSPEKLADAAHWRTRKPCCDSWCSSLFTCCWHAGLKSQRLIEVTKNKNKINHNLFKLKLLSFASLPFLCITALWQCYWQNMQLVKPNIITSWKKIMKLNTWPPQPPGHIQVPNLRGKFLSRLNSRWRHHLASCFCTRNSRISSSGYEANLELKVQSSWISAPSPCKYTSIHLGQCF